MVKRKEVKQTIVYVGPYADGVWVEVGRDDIVITKEGAALPQELAQRLVKEQPNNFEFAQEKQ